MKHLISSLVFAAGTGLAVGIHGGVLTFDGAPAGTSANVFVPPGLAFHHAVFAPDEDEFGEPIPGTEKWRRDPDAPEVLVENPLDYGRGTAPSPANALQALWQPVLLQFDTASDLASFSVVLDLDSFGANGFAPGFADIAVQFLDPAGVPLFTLPVDQTTPGFVARSGRVEGVGSILLPAGAFYDNLAIVPVPEPGAWPTVTGLAVLGFAWAYSRRRWR